MRPSRARAIGFRSSGGRPSGPRAGGRSRHRPRRTSKIAIRRAADGEFVHYEVNISYGKLLMAD